MGRYQAVVDEISAKKKKKLLERESLDRSAIIQTILLGPAGGACFESRLTDLEARSDFDNKKTDRCCYRDRPNA